MKDLIKYTPVRPKLTPSQLALYKLLDSALKNDFSIKAWFKYNIGAIIMKGYCIVMPKFDIKEVDPQHIDCKVDK